MKNMFESVLSAEDLVKAKELLRCYNQITMTLCQGLHSKRTLPDAQSCGWIGGDVAKLAMKTGKDPFQACLEWHQTCKQLVDLELPALALLYAGCILSTMCGLIAITEDKPIQQVLRESDADIFGDDNEVVLSSSDEARVEDVVHDLINSAGMATGKPN